MDIYGYYARQAGWRVARRFLSELKSTITRLAAFPGLGEIVRTSKEFEGTRRSRLSSQFRSIVIYYIEVDDHIEIVRILHSGRDFERLLGES